MSYQIIEKEDGNRYLIFEEKEYLIWQQQGKFLKVRDEAIESNFNENIFNLETGEFFLKERVLSCWVEDFGIEIWKDLNLWRQNKSNFFSLEARCEVFKEGAL